MEKETYRSQYPALTLATPKITFVAPIPSIRLEVLIQFVQTVTQSSFAAPCTKLVDDDGPDDDGDDVVADSGFIPVTDASTPTVWNYTVTTDDPTWFYCAQASPVK